MRHIILFLTLVLSQILWAQRHRFTYEYQYTLDSTKTDTLNKAFMILDITPNESSYYYDIKKFKQDSTNIESVIRQKRAGLTDIVINVSAKIISDIVRKSYSDFKIHWFTTIEQTLLMVEENSDFKWNLLPDTKTIEGYPCQKATTKFGGRNWTAWFTMDIPFPEGPYKFHGLPGLIVKLENENRTHQFLLKGSKKLTPEDLSWNYIIQQEKEGYNLSGDRISVNRKQFKKLWQDYLQDPIKELKKDLMNPNYNMTVNINGKKITDKMAIIRYYRERAEEEIKRKNNPIELDLVGLEK